MRNADPAFVAALAGARDTGIVPRRFVYFTVREWNTGLPFGLGVWTGDDDVTVSLQSGLTGDTVTRDYHGDGNVLQTSPIPRVADLTIQTVTITLSQIADVTQLLTRGYDIRLGKVEIHDALLDPKTRQLISAPQIVFMGEIDGSPIATPKAGEDGTIEIKAVSDAISMLTRKNPAKSSYEGQKRRGGDEAGKYSSTIATWRIPWGEKQ